MRRVIMPALLLALGLAACDTRRTPDEESRNVRLQGAGSAEVPPSLTYARPLAHRREMQGLVDSASLLLSRGDTTAVAGLLHRAAAFLLAQANAPTSGGTGELIAAATALDSLAAHLPARPAPARRAIDALSARANLAEASRHAARASEAWGRHNRRDAADELVITSDHIQRAALDARLELSPSLRRHLAELQDIVNGLPTRTELEQDALDEVLAALHEDVLALQARLRGGDARR